MCDYGNMVSSDCAIPRLCFIRPLRCSVRVSYFQIIFCDHATYSAIIILCDFIILKLLYTCSCDCNVLLLRYSVITLSCVHDFQWLYYYAIMFLLLIGFYICSCDCDVLLLRCSVITLSCAHDFQWLYYYAISSNY